MNYEGPLLALAIQLTNSTEELPKKSLRLPIQLQSVTATKRGAVVTVLRRRVRGGCPWGLRQLNWGIAGDGYSGCLFWVGWDGDRSEQDSKQAWMGMIRSVLGVSSYGNSSHRGRRWGKALLESTLDSGMSPCWDDDALKQRRKWKIQLKLRLKIRLWLSQHC